MNILLILKVIGAVATIATGVYALIKPRAIKDFTGLDADNPRGVTEVRSNLWGAVYWAGFSAVHPAGAGGLSDAGHYVPGNCSCAGGVHVYG